MIIMSYLESRNGKKFEGLQGSDSEGNQAYLTGTTQNFPGLRIRKYSFDAYYI
jgi:hypothetical protein